MKKLLITSMLVGSIVLSGCGNKVTDEEIARQEIYEVNVANAPVWSDEITTMINESRGVVIDEEAGEGEGEVIEIRNSFSPGEKTVVALASLTREELLELDSISHMEIFINGVIRDEYTVAAHTLYGKEEVEKLKQEFKQALLAVYPESLDEKSVYPEGTTYVDLLSGKSKINDYDVARHHIDIIVDQLNRIFVQIVPVSDFGDKVMVRGQVYPIMLASILEEVANATFEFTGIDTDRYRSYMSDEELDSLNDYHRDTFANALLMAPISDEDYKVADIGGFIQREDGTWVPAQMEIFALNLVRLIYNI